MVPQVPFKDMVRWKYGDMWPEYYVGCGNGVVPRREDVQRFGRQEVAKGMGNGRWRIGRLELDPGTAHHVYFVNVLKGMPKIPRLGILGFKR